MDMQELCFPTPPVVWLGCGTAYIYIYIYIRRYVNMYVYIYK